MTCSCFRVVIRRTDQSRPPDQIRLHGGFCSLVEEGGCRVIISVTVFHCYQWVACRDMMVTATRGAAALVMTAAVPSTLHFSGRLVGIVPCVGPLLPIGLWAAPHGGASGLPLKNNVIPPLQSRDVLNKNVQVLSTATNDDEDGINNEIVIRSSDSVSGDVSTGNHDDVGMVSSQKLCPFTA